MKNHNGRLLFSAIHLANFLGGKRGSGRMSVSARIPWSEPVASSVSMRTGRCYVTGGGGGQQAAG
jgi:hypothetical protein